MKPFRLEAAHDRRIDKILGLLLFPTQVRFTHHIERCPRRFRGDFRRAEVGVLREEGIGSYQARIGDRQPHIARHDRLRLIFRTFAEKSVAAHDRAHGHLRKARKFLESFGPRREATAAIRNFHVVETDQIVQALLREHRFKQRGLHSAIHRAGAERGETLRR